MSWDEFKSALASPETPAPALIIVLLYLLSSSGSRRPAIAGMFTYLGWHVFRHLGYGAYEQCMSVAMLFWGLEYILPPSRKD